MAKLSELVLEDAAIGPSEKVGPVAEPTQSVPTIPPEHKTFFINAMADEVHKEFIRLNGAFQGGMASNFNMLGVLTGLNSNEIYRGTFVDPEREFSIKAKELAPAPPYKAGKIDVVSAIQNPAIEFGKTLALPGNAKAVIYGFTDAVGGLLPTLPVDIVTGGLLKTALAGRILPQVERILMAMPDFTLGMGIRGMAEGIQETEGGVVEKTIGGVVSGAESMSMGLLFANTGGGLAGVGKMAALGLATAFYEAAKFGRIPSKDEIASSTMNSAVLGVAFAVVPHIIEGTKIPGEKKALRGYQDRFDAVMPKDVRTYEITNAEGIDLSASVNANLLRGYSIQDISASAPFGEPTTVLGKELAAKLGKNYEQLKLLSLAGKDIKIRRDARRLLYVISDRVEEGFKAEKLSKFNPESELFKGLLPKSTPANPSEVIKIAEDMLSDPKVRDGTKDAIIEILCAARDQKEFVMPELSLGQWKDRWALRLHMDTMIRNIEKVATPEDVVKMREEIFDPVKANDTRQARMETDLREGAKALYKRLKIKRQGRDDELVMLWGEKKITDEQLRTESPNNYENIKTAAKWFRDRYDKLIDAANDALKKAGYDPIGKRDDYFRHTQELRNNFETFGLVFGAERASTAEAGIVKRNKIGRPISSAEKHRETEKTVVSAIANFDNYVLSISNVIHHTDSVQRLRALDNYIRAQAKANEKIDLTGFVDNLVEYTNIMAGQRLEIDKQIEKYMGRPFYGFLRAIDDRVIKNMIVGNIRSAGMNTIVLTQYLADMNPKYSIPSLAYAMFTPFLKHEFEYAPGVYSDLWARRFKSRRIDITGLEKTEAFVAKLFELVDQYSVKAILRGKYNQAFAETGSAEKAKTIADEFGERMILDRSKTQMPVIQQVGGLKLFTHFQAEVTNMIQWLVHDVPAEHKGNVLKIAGVTIAFAILSNLYNTISEELGGGRPTIDPIHFLAMLAGMDESTKASVPRNRIAPAVKDFVSSLPYGNLIMEGGRFPLTAAIPKYDRVGAHPWEELSKPLFYAGLPVPIGGGNWVLAGFPFGGGQVRKTVFAVKDFLQGRSLDSSGARLRYNIAPTLDNFMRGFLLGRSAFSEAVDYWQKNRRR